jgi:hypothetical protein
MTLHINTTYAIGNREGLTDTIADLFADDVPFFATAEKIPATSPKHEWQTDALPAAAVTGIIEGASISYAQPTHRARKYNYTQIRLRNWDISFTQLSVNVAGIKDQVGREMMKAMKALLTDYDKRFLSSGVGSPGATVTNARLAKGIQRAIVTNTGRGSSAGGAVPQALTESKVNALLQKIWTQGGDPRALFCGAYQKRVISTNFTAKTGFSFRIEASARTAIANINKYEGSFGTLDIIPDRQAKPTDIVVVTPDHLKVAVLRDIEQYKGAPTASSVKGWVEAEMTLQWGNEKAHGKQTHLKTGSVAGV